jgi:hypothetical protein
MVTLFDIVIVVVELAWMPGIRRPRAKPIENTSYPNEYVENHVHKHDVSGDAFSE